MTIDSVDVDAVIKNAKQLIEAESELSPALRSALSVLLLLVSVLLNRTTLNRKNSSKPPSSDPNRIKSRRTKSNKSSGAQKDHVGTTLKKVAVPDGVSKAVQYGNKIKAHAVYLSQYQLLPYKRIQEYFADQLAIPLSEGSLYNFNQQAFHGLEEFEQQRPFSPSERCSCG